MKKVFVTIMVFAAMTTQAQSVVDLTKWEDSILCLDDTTEHVDTIILKKESINVQAVQQANILINDSVIMFGTTDGALFRIDNGQKVRPFCDPPFAVAQFSGEPSVYPGSALLDSRGKYCYAWGNAIIGGGRINFIKKMDFYTGEVVDSIDVNSGDFSLSKDDSLRLAVNNDFLTCFPEYTFHLPSEGRVTRIRFFDCAKMWIRLSHDGRRDNYICNQDGTQVKRIVHIVYQGKNIDPHSIIGFSPHSLASAVKTETGYIITIFHLKTKKNETSIY